MVVSWICMLRFFLCQRKCRRFCLKMWCEDVFVFPRTKKGEINSSKTKRNNNNLHSKMKNTHADVLFLILLLSYLDITTFRGQIIIPRWHEVDLLTLATSSAWKHREFAIHLWDTEYIQDNLCFKSFIWKHDIKPFKLKTECNLYSV